MKHFSLLIAICSLLVTACSENKTAPSTTNKRFIALTAQQTGIDFSNDLTEDSVINYFTYPYIYMGGGVAVGDVNNDGLQDLFFTGNMVENKLYLNKGNLQFEDITNIAGVAGDDRWVTGVTMADVNADGWTDIYVSVSGKFTTTKNLLYLNNGVEEGVPTFREAAEEAGIADEGHSTNGTFFDYDHDGDLDLYVANYPYTDFKTPSPTYAFKLAQHDSIDSDRLFRNNGDGTFIDVAKEAGVQNFGLGLSATVGDLNQDGWEDIYVSNDFAVPDFMYFNNGDGTFSERVKEATTHIAYFGMGTDIADFNNDGLADILQVDMTPEDNRRSKANMASMNPPGFWEIVGLGMHYQYMQNALQLNNGVDQDGLPHFSDVSRLAGMASTDWSWAALFADLDNDGWKDVFISNGTRRDINNKDYFHDIEHHEDEEHESDFLQLTLDMPSEKIDNYAYKNNGDLSFTKTTEDWGLSFEGYSNGAVYADLDNDGDLDVVVNNIDDPASVFQNTTSDQKLGNWLRIKLEGPASNPDAIGAKVHVRADRLDQYFEHHVTKGFQSSVDPVIHVGLGQASTVELIEVQWDKGHRSLLNAQTVNQELVIKYSEKQEYDPQHLAPGNQFVNATEELGLTYNHFENQFDDFQYQVLLPHTYSSNGPGLATGDVNGDGLEDFYIGGPFGRPGGLYIQKPDGSFELRQDPAISTDYQMEDMGAVMFDADGDGDLDLYVTSGGGQYPTGSALLMDRLYINDGKGQFTRDKNAIPKITSDGGRVVAGDYDNDGDLDLFVAGRVKAQEYPMPAASYILNNQSSEGRAQFVDVTPDVAPELAKAGLVTDAQWVDFNSDGLLDLVYTAEWKAPTFLQNQAGKLVDQTAALGLEKATGWWYSLASGDFDNDGDIDFIAGNLGLNYKYQASESETFDVYVKDYDKNGKIDIVLGYYNNGVQYPVRGRSCSSEQIPGIKKKYPNYETFSKATLQDIYTTPDLQNSLHYKAHTFATSYIENKGDHGMAIRPLMNEVQLSAVKGIVVDDFDKDGNLDAVVAGNLFGAEVETPRGDAGYGKFLKGDGKGGFTAVPYQQSGLFLDGDVKDLAMVKTIKGNVILAGRNNNYINAVKVQ